MTIERRRKIVDKFQDNRWNVITNVSFVFSWSHLNWKWRKNCESQLNFDINTCNWNKCHSKNVIIEKNQSSCELRNEQITITKWIWIVVDKSLCQKWQAKIKKSLDQNKKLLHCSNELKRASIRFVEVKSVRVCDLVRLETKMNHIQNNDVKIKNNERITNEILFQYAKFQDIFSKMNAHKLFEHDSQNHVIEILFDRESFFDSIYNLFVAELIILKTYIDEYMKKRFIIKFVLFASVFILFVKKLNDKLRLCVNYRDLNEIIIKNRYSLFLINENLNKLFEVKIFSKLNIRDVFHRIRIRNDDEWKTTFKCRFDHY
jgi:hypothetical protein